MKVLLIEVDTESRWSVASIGPAALAATLVRAGHARSFLRATLDMADADVVAAVPAAAPDLIGVSMTNRQWQRARHLVAAVRVAVDVPVIAGGLHATFAPEAVLAADGFDYVCLGEGEGPCSTSFRPSSAITPRPRLQGPGWRDSITPSHLQSVRDRTRRYSRTQMLRSLMSRWPPQWMPAVKQR